MKKIFLLLALPLSVAASAVASAASVHGVALGVDGKGAEEPLAGATVFWLGAAGGATADANGVFLIARTGAESRLVVMSFGYQTDTVTVDSAVRHVEVRLAANTYALDEVEVHGQQKGTSISRINAITTEVISSAGLTKLACCNLAESFENSATVTVGFSDAVSGTKQIRMLGLAGIYSQMLDESRPVMRGLAATYGLSYTPGAWMEGIQISKGTSSVAAGYDAVTGQINMEIRKPTSPERLFVNAYLNSDYRGELNVAWAAQLTPALHNILLLHASGDPSMVDVNGDGFADQPQARQLNVADRWLYTFGSGAMLRAGVRFLTEDRQGGQTNFDRKTDRSDTLKYGSYMANRNFNAYAKLGIPFGSDQRSSAALVADYTLHEQKSFFGQKIYNGTEQSVYVNGLLQLQLGQRHSATFGLGLRGDFYEEEYSFGRRSVIGLKYLLHENELVGGAFGEYTFSIENKLTAIAGLRVDQNSLYGTLVTPRVHVKYDVTETLAARASAGRGLRSPNAITDNIWVMASQRDVEAAEKPKMEEAWTYGVSLVKYIRVDNREKATISADFFHTSFANQLIVDQEVSGNRILAYNLDGASYANTWQVDANVEPVERLGIYATFRYSDTKVQLREVGFARRPLVDRFKGLLNVSYATKFNKWMLDVTAQLNGQSRLPDSRYVAYDYDAADGYSPVYPMFYAQITKRYRTLDVYLGCENIANYMQENPIISAGNPGGKDFNASVIWGPLMGRKFYLGLRWTLDR
ncbi:MAG: TonB-dependent receptor [Prevotellaceae bacterium]|jgi:outer membrane receptor protein involved in Fe transport|nr:TonB-dependent receptor [Prevotellaceae bacterium]